MDIFPTNTILTNVTSTVPINWYNKRIRYKIDYILLAFVLSIMLLIAKTFICQCLTSKSKQKHVQTQAI